MNTHTLGPWKIDDRVIVSASGQLVSGCVVSRMTPADASLIAAAPELLEAIEARYQALPCSSRPVWWTDDAAWVQYVESDERFNALIAKAKGTPS